MTAILQQQNGGREASGSPRSWGEALVQYKHEKSTTQQELPEIYRYTRTQSSNWRENQSQVNPILQKFSDSKRETEYSKLEDDVRMRTMNKGLDKALISSSSFNIITQEDYQMKNHRATPPVRHQSVKMVPAPLIAQTKDAVDLIPKKRRLHPQTSDPSYDNVYSRYYEKDESRKINDNQKRDESILNRTQQIQSKDNYLQNPITQDDPGDVQKLEKQSKKIHYERRHLSQSHTPNYIRIRDTAAHDLISIEPKSTELLATLERKDQLPLGVHYKNSTLMNQFKQDRGTLAKQQAFKRIVNKSTHAKLKEHITTPYNVISNKAYVGIDSIKAPVHLGYLHTDERQRSVWDHLQSSGSVPLDDPSLNSPRLPTALSSATPPSTMTQSKSVTITTRKKATDEQPYASTSSLYAIPAQKIKKGVRGELWVDNVVVYPKSPSGTVEFTRNSETPAVMTLTKHRVISASRERSKLSPNTPGSPTYQIARPLSSPTRFK
jgi:hypothetical protein